MSKKAKVYIFSIIISLGVGIISAILTIGNMNIYDEIVRPQFSPPSFLFPIVWTILYVLMGISSALIYFSNNVPLPQKKSALYVYILSLFFNFFWSILFFNFKVYGFAFFWLLALLFLIAITIIKYYKINQLAAILQIPYLLWVAFAGYLNLSIWILN